MAFDAREAIEQFGVAGARHRAASALERNAIDAAAVLAQAGTDPLRRIYGSLLNVCMPYRDPGALAVFERQIGDLKFTLRSGSQEGLPFGAKARNILTYWTDLIVQRHSATVYGVGSMHEWLQCMNIAVGGMTYRQMSNQAHRIGDSYLTIAYREPDGANWRGIFAGPMVDALHYDEPDGALHPPFDRARLDRLGFPDRASFNPGLSDWLIENRVALDWLAIFQINDNCWAMDVYTWLAAILPTLRAPQTLSWEALCANWSSAFAEKRRVKAKLKQTFPLVQAVYPGARIELGNSAVILHPSPAPV
ncbi:replication protein RepA [Sphingobium sp. Sx8-8]|uniref:replication protein RepA n=1 Tax=Sphingobium sp. Sx8-8 TaxID=2933617 RepID=UPI001F583A10|nr:replication protein RepA [Sphingobium sp. Sx8-8]